MRTLLFYLSALLLAGNDFWLKAELHNSFTGKLSDFAGIALWVLFWEAWLPQRTRPHLYALTVLLFVAFKSPIAQPVLDFLHLQRVIDYTDIFALAVLLPLYFWNFEPKKSAFSVNKTWQPTVAGSVLALFLFAATSPSRAVIDNQFGCDTAVFGIGKSKQAVTLRLKTLFPNNNDFNNASGDTSLVTIGFRAAACSKGISASFYLKSRGTDSVTMHLNMLTTVCKGSQIDPVALCRAVQDSIIQKLY